MYSFSRVNISISIWSFEIHKIGTVPNFSKIPVRLFTLIGMYLFWKENKPARSASVNKSNLNFYDQGSWWDLQSLSVLDSVLFDSPLSRDFFLGCKRSAHIGIPHMKYRDGCFLLDIVMPHIDLYYHSSLHDSPSRSLCSGNLLPGVELWLESSRLVARKIMSIRPCWDRVTVSFTSPLTILSPRKPAVLSSLSSRNSSLGCLSIYIFPYVS